MISPNEIRNQSFDKAVRGYKPEDVNDYLDQIADALEKAYADRDKAYDERDAMLDKLQTLAERIEDYRDEEETLKLAMINAQRMGESIIKDARQKAEDIIREAQIRADDRVQNARDEVARASAEYDQIRREVGHFKANVLKMYKEHIQSLSLLQVQDDSPDRQAEREEVFADEKPEEPRYQQPGESAFETENDGSTSEFSPDRSSRKTGTAVNFGEFDRDDEEDGEPLQHGKDEAEDDALPSVYDDYKGIQFDD